jgi:hypothetical protein
MHAAPARLRATLVVGAVSAALGASVVLSATATATTAPRSAAPTVALRPAAVAATASALPVLRRGSTGPYVVRVQSILRIPRTGVFGRRTALHVAAFQKKKGLPATGIVNAKTWKALLVFARTRPALAATGGDPTMSATMRGSRAARAALPFTVWQSSPHGRYISNRESHNTCTVVSSNGLWRGKWQMTMSLWRGYGGTTYASAPERASCVQQDQVAYRVWISSWWGPWGG